jgi:hypothetical protein
VSLSTFVSGGYNWGSITGLAPAAINYKYGDTHSVSLTTGTAADTVYVLATGVPTSISTSGGSDVVNVGNAGSVQGIQGALSIQNPPSYTTINLSDWADSTVRTASLSTFASGGYNWGSISGLAPAAINYKYYDTSSPVNVYTVVGKVSWNVSANAMASVSGILVYDNGYPINAVPIQPTADTAYSPAPATAPLFNGGGPSYLDVEQGAVGDCWLMASLAEVAARDPQDIVNMFTYNGTIVDSGSTVGLYTVRFFNTNGSAVYIQVDTELPSGGEYYDHVQNDLGSQALWVALAEKAYAVANGYGYVTTSNMNQNSYDALSGGWPSWALHAITGNYAAEYSVNTGNLISDWNAGDLIVMCTDTPVSSYIVPSHCYALVGYNSGSGLPFELFNAWGTDSSGWAPGCSGTIYGLFNANAPFISQNFAEQSVGTAAINVNNSAALTNQVTESGTLDGGYASSGTINITQYKLSRVTIAETSGGSSGYARPAQATAIGVDFWLASEDFGSLKARRFGNG